MHHDNQSDSRVLPDSSIPTTETTRGWLRNTLSLLVDHPDDVRVEASDGQASAVFEAFVNPVDVRRVIGKGGRTVQALRDLLINIGAKGGRRFHLTVDEPSLHRRAGAQAT